MDINLDELITLQSALVHIQMVLSEERKIDPEKVAAIVDRAYEVVMKKVNSLQQPSYL